MRLFAGISVVLLFSAVFWYFLKDIPRNYDLLQDIVERRFEDSNFVWLVQHGSFFDEAYRVALIFGYADNLTACLEIAEDNERRYPLSQYSCEVVGN